VTTPPPGTAMLEPGHRGGGRGVGLLAGRWHPPLALHRRLGAARLLVEATFARIRAKNILRQRSVEAPAR